MTQREKEILDIIRQRPLASQQEIAETLHIARPSVAVHITNLMKKGYIKGKGYILSDEENYVVCIGAANADITAYASAPVRMGESNPSKIGITAGGVSRNIGENLQRLGVPVKLLSCIGGDVYGEKISAECQAAGMDISQVSVEPGRKSSTYIALIDEMGELLVGMSDMSILKNLSIDYIKQKHSVIKGAQLIVMDPGLSEEVFDYILNTYGDKPIFVDSVSTAYAQVVRRSSMNIFSITANRLEAQTLSGIQVRTKEDAAAAAEVITGMGAEHVYITLGRNGVFYRNRTGKTAYAPATDSSAPVINTNGAGTATTAALVYGYLNGFPLQKALEFSMAAAHLTVCHEKTINPNICSQLVAETMKECAK